MKKNDGNGSNCPKRSILPSARTISHKFHTDFKNTSIKVTNMVTQWGQFLDHDFAQTPRHTVW